MKELPQRLHVKNKDDFREYYYKRTMCYLRREIYEHVLSSIENFYFTLEDFRVKYKLSGQEISSMSATIMDELRNLGWTCQLSYGGTALFIYSTVDPPPLCYPDGF